MDPARPGPPARLSVSGISKRFGPVQALSGVSFDVAPGEIVALAGENGSGKSTLARILAGALLPDEGSFALDGAPCHFVRPRDGLDARVAMVSQEPTAAPELSVAENVLLPSLGGAFRRVSRRSLERRAAPHLERVGLAVDPGRPFGSLDQSARELAEIAKAVAVEPRLLVLDEATTRLADPERLFRVVEELVADGASAILITHRLREIRRLCHRAVVLRDGHLVAELGRAELTDERISAAMVGRELTEFFAKPAVVPSGTVLRVDGLVTDRSPNPISLEVRKGEIVGLAGLVGSGRSEVLETIAGIRRSRGGEVQVGGLRLRPGSPKASIGAGVALVPEDRFAQGLVRDASVCSNLSLASHRVLGRTDRRSERSRARDAVARLGIRCAGIDAPVASLSGGNAQKVVVARCLGQSPSVLLLDEPTRGVDVGAKAEIYGLIADMVAGDMGVLLASSDLLELLGLCDRIVVLHEGGVVGELDRSEASEEALALLSAGGRRSAA